MDVSTDPAIVRLLLEFWNAYMGKSMVLNGIELWDQQALASVADGDGVGVEEYENSTATTTDISQSFRSSSSKVSRGVHQGQRHTATGFNRSEGEDDNFSKTITLRLMLILQVSFTTLPSELLGSMAVATAEDNHFMLLQYCRQLSFFADVTRIDLFSTEELMNFTLSPISKFPLSPISSPALEKLSGPDGGANMPHVVIISVIVGLFWCCLVAVGLAYPISARARIKDVANLEILSNAQQNPIKHDPTLLLKSHKGSSFAISMGDGTVKVSSMDETQNGATFMEGNNCEHALDVSAYSTTDGLDKSFVSSGERKAARSMMIPNKNRQKAVTSIDFDPPPFAEEKKTASITKPVPSENRPQILRNSGSKEGLAKTTLDMEFEQATESFRDDKPQQQETRKLRSSSRGNVKSSLRQSMASQKSDGSADPKRNRGKLRGSIKPSLTQSMESQESNSSADAKKSGNWGTLRKSLVTSEKPGGLRHSDTRRPGLDATQGSAKSLLDMEFEQAMESFKIDKPQQQGAKDLDSSLRRNNKSSLSRSMAPQGNNNTDVKKSGNRGKLRKSMTTCEKPTGSRHSKTNGGQLRRSLLDMEFENAMESFRNKKPQQQESNDLRSSERKSQRQETRNLDSSLKRSNKSSLTRSMAPQGNNNTDVNKSGNSGKLRKSMIPSEKPNESRHSNTNGGQLRRSSLDMEFEKSMESSRNKKPQQQESNDLSSSERKSQRQERRNLDSSLRRNNKSSLTRSMAPQGNNNTDVKKSDNSGKLRKTMIPSEKPTGSRHSETNGGQLRRSLLDKEFEQAMESFKNKKLQQQETNDLSSSGRRKVKSMQSQEGKKNEDARKSSGLRRPEARNAAAARKNRL